MDVSRDNISGFLLGISVGVAVGIVLKLSDKTRPEDSGSDRRPWPATENQFMKTPLK